MVWQQHTLGRTSSKIAKKLNVHRLTVDRILKRIKEVYPKEAVFEASVELMYTYQPLAALCYQVDLPDRIYAMLHYKRMHLTEHSMYLMFWCI